MEQLIRQFTAQHPRLAEIIRFLIVGGSATLIDYFVMGVVLYCFEPSLYPHFYNIWIGGGAPSTLATVVGTGIGFATSLVFNYIFSILFVFREKGNARSAKGFFIFAVLSIGGLLINLGGMYLGYNVIGINEWLVKTFFTIVVLVYNYLTRKILLFKAQPTNRKEQQA
ncbi:MAG: GtrA family protein [Prevotella sp.]|nr:GtrA family protein [Prevotella sp.]